MTLDEAKKLCKIAADVDSGCPVCVECVVEDMNKAFPEFEWKFDHMADDTVTVRPRDGQSEDRK